MLLKNLEGKRIVLASASPRRRELMKMLSIPFEIAGAVDVDEVYPADTPAEKVPEFLSQLKAAAYKPLMDADTVIVTADTVVILDNEVIGKPRDEADACRMIGKLSGRTHRVVTGVTLASKEKQVTFSVTTEVDFAPLTPEEISYYVGTFHPLDKAGAYGIQEWIGAVGIRGIRGSFYNVMGLPVNRLWNELSAF